MLLHRRHQTYVFYDEPPRRLATLDPASDDDLQTDAQRERAAGYSEYCNLWAGFLRQLPYVRRSQFPPDADFAALVDALVANSYVKARVEGRGEHMDSYREALYAMVNY